MMKTAGRAKASVRENNLMWIVAVLVGGVIGTQLGSRWLPIAVLRYLLAAVLVIAGLKLVLA
jgi:uncharacterized membrane protein YfcA